MKFTNFGFVYNCLLLCLTVHLFLVLYAECALSIYSTCTARDENRLFPTDWHLHKSWLWFNTLVQPPSIVCPSNNKQENTHVPVLFLLVCPIPTTTTDDDDDDDSSSWTGLTTLTHALQPRVGHVLKISIDVSYLFIYLYSIIINPRPLCVCFSSISVCLSACSCVCVRAWYPPHWDFCVCVISNDQGRNSWCWLPSRQIPLFSFLSRVPWIISTGIFFILPCPFFSFFNFLYSTFECPFFFNAWCLLVGHCPRFIIFHSFSVTYRTCRDWIYRSSRI